MKPSKDSLSEKIQEPAIGSFESRANAANTEIKDILSKYRLAMIASTQFGDATLIVPVKYKDIQTPQAQ